MKSLRLLSASKYIKGYNCLADCGTDHAKLPIYCVSKGLVKKAYASDNKIGPITNAINSVNEAGLDSLVKVILADGLTYLTPEIDVVSILGMGGRLINSILEKANLVDVKRLVLIANSENYLLRSFLEDNNWFIETEELIKENNKFYQLMVLKQGKMNLSEVEKEFGPFIIKQKSKNFIEMITKLIVKLEIGKRKAKTKKTIDSINQRIEQLKGVI
ncbi:MAG: class I SAM-dependent methyltransferase [Candidatus Izemoplasmatales bacterium]